MRIGIITPPNSIGQTTLDGLIEQVKRAEMDGLSSFWFVQLPSSGNEVLTAIALAAGHTTRIELGTAVVPIYSRHPLVLAQQAATVQLVTGKRFTLGVGLSHKPVVENMMGLSYDKPAATMREYLSVLRPLVDHGHVNFSGSTYRVNSGLDVPGSSPFPILVAALAPLMLRIAGELADGTVTWMVGTETVANHIVPRISAAAENAGRRPPRICVGLPITVTDDPAAAREQAANAFVRYGQLRNYRRMLDLEGAVSPADVAIIGNEQEVEAQLAALADAGATDFLASVFPVGEDPVASEQRTWAHLTHLNGSL